MNNRESGITCDRQPTAKAFPIHRNDQREIKGRDSPVINTLGLKAKEPDPFLFWLMLEQREQG